MKFKCPICQAYFTRKWNRDRHLAGNRCTKSYICDICGKYYSRKEHLERHKSVHFQPSDAPNASVNTQNSVTSKRKRKYVNITYLTPSDTPVIPHFLTDIPAAVSIYREHYSAIRSFKMTSFGKIRHVYNYRLETGDVHEISEDLMDIFRKMKYRFKVNCSFGCLLENIETGKYRYWHSSQNNYLLFSQPLQIRNHDEYKAFIDKVLDSDIESVAAINRDNTKWKLRAITNLCLFFFRMLEIPIGAKVHLPLFIFKNKGLTHIHGKNRNICLFECLALFFKEKKPELAAKDLCEKYTGRAWEEFKGIKMSKLKSIEMFFNIRIHVYTLNKNKQGKVIASLVRQSTHDASYPVMFINKYRNHFTFISNFSLYCQWLTCSICHGNFRTRRHCELVRHEKICQDKVRELFPGGIYVPPKNIFQRLQCIGIHVPRNLWIYPYRIFYDTESMLQPITGNRTAQCEFTNLHSLASIAYTSNVPGFTDVKCIVRQKKQSTFSFIKNCMKELSLISFRASEKVIDYLEPYLEDFEKQHNLLPRDSRRYKFLSKLKKDILQYIKQIPTLGFNSKSYDLPLFLAELASFILKTEGKSPFILRRNNKYIGILTDHFRFLDISNYLSPGISYAGYLKAFDCSESKFFFPYEYFTDLDVLDEVSLPPHNKFYSTLKNKNISLDEYEYCKKQWTVKGMQNMRDYLIYYNSLDVGPAMEAIDKHMSLLYKLGIDPLKESFTISGVAFQYLFIKSYAPLSLMNRRELFYSLKASLIGGPSIVFTRHAKVDETRIKPHRYSNPRKVKAILGFDANSLYLSVLQNPMPTGFVVIREEAQNFKPKILSSQSFKATCWIDFMERKTCKTFQNALFHGEVRVGNKNIKVDGYHCSETGSVTILQFMGCFYHAHNCLRNNGKNGDTTHPFRDPLTYAEVLQETLDNCSHIRQQGFTLHVMWECEWDALIQVNSLASQIVQDRSKKKCGQHMLTLKQVIELISTDKIFGILECDIHVPKHLEEIFTDFPPIFKHATIGRESIGQLMRIFCETNNLLTKPRKLLISSFHAKKQWFLSPVLKWYIHHGLVIDRVHRILEFDRETPFNDVVNEITYNRRKADVDPKYKTLGDSFKLIGNSIFGKSILAKEKLHSHLFCFEDDAERFVRSSRFRNLHEIGHGVCEIEQSRKTINQNMPIILGFSILNYAKLSVLKFYYDFIKKFIPDHRLTIMETDTDSLYLALSKPTLEECVSNSKIDEFLNEVDTWMPIKACDMHRNQYNTSIKSKLPWKAEKCCLDKYKQECRTPGKWKLEAEGDEMICLNSKTYILQNTGDCSKKISTKGVSKTQNNYTINQFKDVLESQRSVCGINRGIKTVKRNEIMTYTQTRTALTYMYIKREVLDDGINTIPIKE